MISRYSLPEMESVFADETRFSRWVEIELLATEAHATIGVVPAADAVACRAKAPVVDASFVDAVAEREKVTDHDVAAFVDVMQSRIGGAESGWIHYGLTSTDVVDTALCWALRDAADLLVDASSKLLRVLVNMAKAHRDTVMIGRTHGVHAEPTTFGAKVALWALQVERDRERLVNARRTIAVCKLSGAVGTYSNIDPRVESAVASSLGLEPVPATQVISRDRHAEYMWACASVGATCEMIAVELRHLQRTEVREVEEGFKAGQKGSSAMPHKRNPISAETISGLSRVLRGNLQAALQDVALWHERDISHSSVERIVLPDSERRRGTLMSSRGLGSSQPVLLALVQRGRSRDDAYRIVQEAATVSWTRSRDFRSVLEENDRVRQLGGAILDDAFDLTRSLGRIGVVFDALDRIEV